MDMDSKNFVRYFLAKYLGFYQNICILLFCIILHNWCSELKFNKHFTLKKEIKKKIKM